MGYLTNKIIKIKKLQKLSSSLVLIIPTNWIEEMNWDRNTLLKLSWHPDEEKIIVTKSENQNQENHAENGQKISDIVTIDDTESLQSS